MVDGLRKRLSGLPRERTQVLPALHLLHEIAGYLPNEGLEEVADWVHMPKSELYAVATSYTEFRLQPETAGSVRVCLGLSCRIAGSASLTEELRAAGRTVEEHECFFLCAAAPVAAMNGRARGRASAGDVA